MTTIATLFSGFELVGVGARQAGLSHLWGVEWDDAIAGVARTNGFHTITADVLDIDPHTLEVPDVLHASPVCTRASVANQSAEVNEDGLKESPLDIAMGEKVAQFIDVMTPRVVTIENVYGYRKFRAFKAICAALDRNGYFWDYDSLNCANYGMIVLCPIHDSKCTLEYVPNAGQNFYQDSPTIAPDIVAVLALMSPEGEARHLALDAVAHLVRVIKRDIVVNVQWHKMQLSTSDEVKKITPGRVAELLMNADMSESELMVSIDENTESLLNICLDAPLLRMRLSTIRMETLKITLLKILSCLKATASIPNYITKNGPNQKVGSLGTDGNCPLCQYKAVPQTRRRLILRAVRGALLPNLPAPERWVGWYEAIEDLIPGLPESQFAPWQLARLPEEIQGALLIGAGNTNMPEAQTAQRFNLITEPSPSVAAQASVTRMRAFILDCQLAGDTQERGVTLRQGNAPMFTVTSGKAGRQPVRAFLIGTNANDSSGAKIYQEAGEPAQVVRTPSGGRELRAYLVSSIDNTIRGQAEPANTLVNAGDGHSITPRAWLSAGRVVSMTPRALARFQSVPDSYLLPENKRLSCTGIGNGFPPLAYQKLITPLVENL